MGELNEKLKDPAYAAEFFLAGVDVHHENKEDADFKVAVVNCRKAIRDTRAERDRYKVQADSAMKACTVSGHDKSHKHPGHCIAALTSILDSR